MIASRSDLTAAKATLDNLDQINAAIASLKGQNGGTVSVALPQHPNITNLQVNVVDALAFLNGLQAAAIAALNTMGVTVFVP